MQKFAVVSLCAVALTASLWAQQPDSKKSTQKPAKRAADTAEVRGLRMLEAAEADAGALDGGMAAFAKLQVARCYEKSDKRKTSELLEQALGSTRAVENEDYGGMGQRARLQSYILRELVNVAPGKVDEFLVQVEAEARESALSSLLSYYETHKQLNRAIEVLYRIAAEKEMPYDTASRLMSALRPEQESELLQIFTTALGSYRDHPEHGNVGDFAGLVVKFKDKLPPQTIREAIDVVFSQAEQQLKEGEAITVGVGSSKGSVSFRSLYEFRLFQLLPTLQELDAAAAEKLLKQHREVAAELERYPLGVASLRAAEEIAAEKRRAENGNGAVWKIRATHETVRARMAEFAKASQVAQDAEEHPAEALANVSTIKDATMRCFALERIARTTLRKDRAVAKSATQKLLDTIDSAEGLDIQLMLLRSAVDLYLRMDDAGNAKSALQRGFDLAEKAYKQDSNADDPNRAMKAFWPSAAAYRWFCGAAAQLSPEWAMDTAAKITDPELRVLAEIALAHTWLKVSDGTTPVITAHKGRPEVLVVE